MSPALSYLLIAAPELFKQEKRKMGQAYPIEYHCGGNVRVFAFNVPSVTDIPKHVKTLDVRLNRDFNHAVNTPLDKRPDAKKIKNLGNAHLDMQRLDVMLHNKDFLHDIPDALGDRVEEELDMPISLANAMFISDVPDIT